MIDVETTFMTQGQEFRVVYKDENKNRISVVPIGEITWLPEVHQKIIIEDVYYKTTYIHKGKNRITLEPVRKGE